MRRSIASLLCLPSLGLALGACASAPSSQAATTGPDGHDEAPAAAPVATEAPAVVAPTALARGLHAHAMTEVVLDAHARAALTLDELGGLRLWPDVRAAEIEPPVVLPEQESSWLSLAQAGDDAFVVATIDTTGTARVSRVTIGERGAERLALFELPATDPQFEIHVLDGGRRILALGKDHRVRLFDNGGRVLSQIDQRGFIPWQLRVVDTPGQPLAVAAVLTQPVRAQSLALEDDSLRIVGEPWMVALDQSPNRNDMALSPDGTTIAALRRHGPRGRGFALQLIELATGNRRVIVGELDHKARPRLHYVDNGRVLLETGSGKGFWIDLAQAVPRDATEFPPAVVQAVALPGAAGDLRMQVTEVAGVRAIANGDILTIDPLDTTDHRRLGRTPLFASTVALDGNGGKVAWSSGTKVFVGDTASPDATPVVFDVGASVDALGFDEQARLLVSTAAGTSVRQPSGEVVTPSGTPPILARFDARAAEKAARVASEGLPLRGRDPMVAAAAPTGSLLALGVRTSNMVLSHRPTTFAALDVFDGEQGRRLWSAPLGNTSALAWSGDGMRIAMHDGAALVVLDGRTGDAVFTRADAGMVVETVSD